MRRICPRGYTMIKGVCKTISTGGDAVFGHTGDGSGYEWTQDVFHKSEWQRKNWMFKQDGSGDIDTPFEHGYNWWQDVFHKSEWQQKDWMFRRGGTTGANVMSDQGDCCACLRGRAGVVCDKTTCTCHEFIGGAPVRGGGAGRRRPKRRRR